MHHYAREILYRPRCRNADRAKWLAGFALVVGLMTALLLRYGFLPFKSAYPVFSAVVVLAALAILLALAAFVRIWRADERGVAAALAGLFCALVIISVPLALRASEFLRPGANEISTDYRALPPFSRTAAAFMARGNTIPSTPPMDAQERQAAANPDISSLVIDTDPDQLFQQVQEIARDNGWTVIATVAPGLRFGDGHVDIIVRTPLLRLPVDMTVRIRPIAGGTRVDIRCVSRYRDFDYVDNAAIVRDLLTELMQGPPLG